MIQKALTTMTICMLMVCMSTTAVAQQIKLKAQSAGAEQTKNVDVGFSQKQFNRFHKKLKKAGYTNIGKLAKAEPEAVADVVVEVGFKVIEVRSGEVYRAKSEDLTEEAKARVAMGMARALIERAEGYKKKKTPIVKGVKVFMAKEAGDLIDNDMVWMISYYETKDIVS